MTSIDNYTIIQHSAENKIVIILPQTVETITNTVTPIVSRRHSLTQNEEAVLLAIVKSLFEGKGEEV